jgi:ATP-dependent helicase/nuclease subunit B
MDGEGRQPGWRRRLGKGDWQLAERLAEAMAAALGPLAAALAAAEISAADGCARLRDALGAIAADATGSDAELWETPAGAALDALLTDVAGEDGGRLLTLDGAEFPAFLAELLRDAVVPAPVREGAVHIWGTLEARLQSVDLTILGGLDEGVWPAETRTDPWLSRAMRAELGLPPPERRTGLAAHDFVQALAAPRVIVSRAEKRGGAPTVESRWLQRLRALAGKEAFAALEARGGRYVGWARRMDVPAGKPRPAGRPRPAPPLAVRPTGLSVTEIETLIRDPYAIYARHVLRLEKLEPLGAEPDAALRGTLIHDALGRFTGEWRASYGEAALARLVEIGNRTLAAVADTADLHAVWTLRFAAIARWLIGWEAGRAARVAERHAEVAGALEIPLDGGMAFRLRGRADRIDRLTDGTLAIYDFKTGTPQSDRSVFAGLTPQMTLEAAMARRGAFEGIPAGLGVSDLAWLAIGKAGRADPYKSAVRRGETADALAEKAYAMLAGLAAAYADPARGYLSRARPMMERARYLGDYDHLARVREWALLESEEDVAT